MIDDGTAMSWMIWTCLYLTDHKSQVQVQLAIISSPFQVHVMTLLHFFVVNDDLVDLELSVLD